MDDQGAGGSSRGGGTNPDRSQIRESSLPSTLLQYLYDGPRHSTSQRIAPLMDIPWPNHPTRSHSRDRGRSLPSPSHLLLQTGPRFDHDRVILSRSLDASPVNPVYIHNPDSPLPRLGLQRQLPPVGIDDPPRPPVDRPMGRYSHPPISRSMSASPLESYRRPHSHVPQHGSQSTSRTPQPLRPPSRQVGPSSGVRDALIDDVGVLPQPEVPDRTLGELYAEMGRSPGFSPVQRRGRSEVRATHTSRPQRTQVQTQGRRMIVEQGPVEGFLRDPQRQVEQIPSRPIRDRRPPILNPTNQNPFEGQRRAQRPSPQLQRLQVHHQPQPQQPVRIPPLLSGPGYQRIVGTSSSPQLASTGESQKVSRFSGELYSGGQSEIKPLHQGSSKAEHPVIETQGGVPERKKAQRSPGVKKEPGTPTVESGSGSTSTGATSSTRKKAASKVTVACDFCRGRKLRCDGGKPCSNCSGRGTECMYQPGGPRRRGPGKAPKKTRAESSRQRQQQRQQQQQTQQQPPDQSQMSISAVSPVSSGPSPIMSVPPTAIFRGGSPLTQAGRVVTTGPRFLSHSPGASNSELETGSQPSRRRLSGSSEDAPERKRSRIRELEGEGRH